jgi:hypothetical protein
MMGAAVWVRVAGPLQLMRRMAMATSYKDPTAAPTSTVFIHNHVFIASNTTVCTSFHHLWAIAHVNQPPMYYFCTIYYFILFI